MPDAKKVAVLAGVVELCLPVHPSVDICVEARLTQSRRQSLSDWAALRSGRIPVITDGVAFLESE